MFPQCGICRTEAWACRSPERRISRLDDELLEKASVQAGVPRGLVKDVAHETARVFTHTWSQHNPGLQIDDLGRRKIDGQLRLVPLFKNHVGTGQPKPNKSYNLTSG